MLKKPTVSTQSVAGFTLIEMLAVIIMVGILSAIAVPSYLGLLNRQRLNVAQNQVLDIMRTAQTNAKREKTTWAACFHDDGTKVEWSVSRLPEGDWSCTDATNRQPLSSDSKVIAINTTSTTMRQSPASSGYYRVRFRFNGAIDTVDGGVANLGKITLAVRNETSGIRRCVVVSTLLGALRPDKDAGCTS